MLNLTLSKLDETLESFVSKNLSEEIQRLRTHLSDSPTQLYRYYQFDFSNLFCGRNLKLDEKIILGVLHWYFHDEIRFVFNLWLEENWGADFVEIRDVILDSKETALGYLLINDRWNNHDFFGNILVQKRIGCLLTNFKWKPLRNTSKTKRYTGYCRGYRESGRVSLHQPEKAIRKKLLTVSEVLEREEIQKQKYESLILQIKEKLLE